MIGAYLIQAREKIFCYARKWNMNGYSLGPFIPHILQKHHMNHLEFHGVIRTEARLKTPGQKNRCSFLIQKMLEFQVIFPKEG